MASLVQPFSAFAFRFLTALCIGLVIPREVVGQNPNPTEIFRVLRGMRLDSLQTGRAVTYFHAADSARAVALHAILHKFLAFAHEQAGDLTIRVAVLLPEEWAQLRGEPYGFPVSFLQPSNLVLIPARPPQLVGPDTLLKGGVRDLMMIGHEGGHLLSYTLLPPGIRDSIGVADPLLSAELQRRMARFEQNPGWYWEFTATYFATAFIKANYPEHAEAWRTYLRVLATQPLPRFHHLDEWFPMMMQAKNPDGTPYFGSPAGSGNFGWYQGVVGVMAQHAVDAERPGFVAQLRRVAGQEEEWPVRTLALINELERMFPGLVATLRALGVTYQ